MRNMFRNGKVTDQRIDNTGCFVRVQWLDKQGLTSRWLPVKQNGSSRAVANSIYCPDIGEDVAVTMLPNSSSGEGFVDGTFYTPTNPPPTFDPNRKHVTFGDGTIMEYRVGDSTFNLDAKGPVNITTSNDVTINGVNIRVSGSGEITLTAPIIRIIGDTTIEGDMTFTGNISHTGDMRTFGEHLDNRGFHDA
jgi:phage baseplate assembly protein V